jgi:hypothetical protein
MLAAEWRRRQQLWFNIGLKADSDVYTFIEDDIKSYRGTNELIQSVEDLTLKSPTFMRAQELS